MMTQIKSLFVSFFVLLPFSLVAESGVVQKSTPIRAFPERGSESAGTVNRGVSVNIIRKTDDWCLIQTTQVKGWVPCSGIAKTKPEQISQRSALVRRESVPPKLLDKDSSFSIAINPLTIVFPWLEVQLGVAVTPRTRINLTPQYMTWAWNGANASEGVFGGTLSTSFFFEDWQGWYVEPGLLYLKPTKGGGFWLGGQVIAGYEHLWDSGMFLNLGLGALIGYFDDGSGSDDWFNLSGTYPLPTGNLHIGWKF